MRYPIIICDREIWLYGILNEEELNFFEEIDVQSNEYHGWDADGLPLVLSYIENTTQVKLLNNESDYNNARRIIYEFANKYGPNKDFHANESDLWKLFVLANNFVNENSFWKRIKKLFFID